MKESFGHARVGVVLAEPRWAGSELKDVARSFNNLFSDPESIRLADTALTKGPLAWLIQHLRSGKVHKEAYRSKSWGLLAPATQSTEQQRANSRRRTAQRQRPGQPTYVPCATGIRSRSLLLPISRLMPLMKVVVLHLLIPNFSIRPRSSFRELQRLRPGRPGIPIGCDPLHPHLVRPPVQALAENWRHRTEACNDPLRPMYFFSAHGVFPKELMWRNGRSLPAATSKPRPPW